MAQQKDSGIVTIHGKEYRTVARRIEDFRSSYATWSIQTEVVARDDAEVVVKATILDDQERVISTGYAEESRAASKINKTSALENAETSAVGRALAFFGDAGTEIASADEVAGAIQQQNGNAPAEISVTVADLRKLMADTETDEAAVVGWATEQQHTALDTVPPTYFPKLKHALDTKAQRMKQEAAS